MNRTGIEAWAQALGPARTIALISHTHPDGDTIGSALGLRLGLLSIGKDVDWFCEMPAPEQVAFLPESDRVITDISRARDSYDVAMSVDVSSPELMGSMIGVFERGRCRVVLDHHATNPGFGDVNFIRPGECACTILAYEGMAALGVPVTPDMALCFMAGLSTDSGHFMFSSTTGHVFRIAGELRDRGVDMEDLTRRLYRSDSPRRVRMKARAYQRLRFLYGGQVGVIAISEQDLEECGCTREDLDGIVRIAQDVRGVRFAFMLTQSGRKVKISMRSFAPETVRDLAERYGGGGHNQASGCTVEMTLAEAVVLVEKLAGEKLGETQK